MTGRRVASAAWPPPPESAAAYQREARAKRQADRAQSRTRMAATQDWLCPWCEQPITPEQIQASEVNVDHIIPKCRGGPGDRWNRQLLHALCNRSGGKWKQLTEAAIQLAAEHGIELREPPKNPGWRRRVLPPPVRQYLDEMDRDI